MADSGLGHIQFGRRAGEAEMTPSGLKDPQGVHRREATSHCASYRLRLTSPFGLDVNIQYTANFCRASSSKPSLFLAGQDRTEQNAHLSEMDAHMLKDIGVTRPETVQEARERFWMA
jgi:hypothetical protein